MGVAVADMVKNPLFLGIVALVEKQYLCSPKRTSIFDNFTIYNFTIYNFTIYNFTIINSKLSILNCQL